MGHALRSQPASPYSLVRSESCSLSAVFSAFIFTGHPHPGEVLAVSVHGSAAASGSQLRDACKTAAYAP